MKRAKTNPRLDKKKFSQVSSTTKSINVKPVIFRGGIRL